MGYGQGRRGVAWGLKWGLLIGGFLSILVLVTWLHLNLRMELDAVRRHVNRGTRKITGTRIGNKNGTTYNCSNMDVKWADKVIKKK